MIIYKTFTAAALTALIAISAGFASAQTFKPAAAASASSATEQPPAFLAAKAPAGIDRVLRDELPKKLPGVGKIDEISTTPITGLFEVRVGKQILYSDAKADYFFNGHIMQATTQRNLTMERVTKLNVLDYKALPFKDSFKVVKGDGSREIAVFVDPNCGYCKKLEQELKSMTNITVHLFPLPILGDNSVEKTRDIWCSADRVKAWEDWMLAGKVPPSAAGKKCDVSAITRNIAFSRANGLSGTPAIIFQDGSRSNGYMAADALNKKLMAVAAGK